MNKRNCSNCNAEIELKNEDFKGYRSNLIFCSMKCHYGFTDRDSEIRKKLNWNALI